MISNEVLQALKDQSEHVQNKSILAFLQEHRGHRNGKMHLYAGPTSAGKSTLSRTLLLDFLGANENKSAGLYLSEESREDFYTEFSFTGIDASKIKHLKIMAEHEIAFETLEDLLAKIDFFITENELDFFLFDNLTTCKIYENSKPATQANFASRLKEICRKREIPFLIVCHTGAMQELNTRSKIDLNAIRGAKTVANLAEFAYTIQAIYKDDKRMTLLCIAKSRGQPVRNTAFELFYYPTRRVFGKAESRSSEEVKAMFEIKKEKRGWQ